MSGCKYHQRYGSGHCQKCGSSLLPYQECSTCKAWENAPKLVQALLELNRPVPRKDDTDAAREVRTKEPK